MSKTYLPFRDTPALIKKMLWELYLLINDIKGMKAKEQNKEPKI